MGISKNILVVFASIGIGASVVAFGVAILLIISGIKEFIVWRIRKRRHEHEIANRFNKQPLAKCHCIDCCYCGGYTQEPKSDDRNEIRCLLWKNANVCFMDDSFCYRAYPRDEK